MKKQIARFLCALACCAPLAGMAQQHGRFAPADQLYTEGKTLFQEENYTAALPALRAFVRQYPTDMRRQEAEYMLAGTAFALNDVRRIELLRHHLDAYPDTPHANRIYSLLAAAYFAEGKYDEALALFNSTDFDLLADQERNDRIYELASAYLRTEQLSEAAVWYETLRATSPRHAADAGYYLSYIRYTQQRYDEALQGFLPLQSHARYGTLVPPYIAEIYICKGQYSSAVQTAEAYLARHRQGEHAAEMHRILGTAHYHSARYHDAATAFARYLQSNDTPRRDALYMAGLSLYHTGVYSQATELLGRATTAADDALAQNAYLHMGLSYLQLAQKPQARMAFQQAAASTADRRIREQAAYNHALSLHETSFSAFGEGVTAFEKFLNEFPSSPYAEKASAHLAEVYLQTRSYEAALRSIERIERPDARIGEAKQQVLFRLGTQSFASARFEEAATYLTRSIAEGSHNRQTRAEAHYWRGEAYYRLGLEAEAARDFHTALQLADRRSGEMYALAHYNLGYIAFHRKDYTQAATYFDQYIRLGEGGGATAVADACNRLGDCHLHARRFEEAKRWYAQAERTDAAYGDYSFYQLALVSGLQKDYPGKITLLNRLVGKYPSSPYAVSALYEKGRSYVLMENNKQAIAAFGELLEKFPESPAGRKAAAEIALLSYQQGNHDQAIAAYRQIIERYPGSEEARLALRDLKSIYVDLNRVDEFAALASALPGHIRFDAGEQDSLTYAAAERLYRRGRTEEARTGLERYLQSFPEGGYGLSAHYYLCLIAYERKNYDGVLLHSARLLEYPDHPSTEEVLALRAEVLFSRGQTADALTAYKLLGEKSLSAERRQLAATGVLRAAFLLKDDVETIHAATDLLQDAKLSPELRNEALYCRAKAYARQQADQKAADDYRVLATDTRNSYGAEAGYLLAQGLYDSRDYAAAERELLQYIERSTPHAYWLARCFVLLSDVYAATGKKLDARQYLLSLQQNYQAEDNIQDMIQERLKNLNN